MIIRRIVFVCIALVSVAPAARAQECSEVRWSEKIGNGNDRLCPGNNPTLDIFYKKDWDIVSTTVCRLNNWKRQDHGDVPPAVEIRRRLV